MDKTLIDGQLEIDHNRGVIYFHSLTGATIIRICNLPTPIPKIGDGPIPERMLDITHLVGQDWQGDIRLKPGSPSTFRLDQVLIQPPSSDVHGDCPILGTEDQPRHRVKPRG